MYRDLHSSLIKWVASRSPESVHLSKGTKRKQQGEKKVLNGHDIFGPVNIFRLFDMPTTQC